MSASTSESTGGAALGINHFSEEIKRRHG
jgi:hypothetical protein